MDLQAQLKRLNVETIFYIKHNLQQLKLTRMGRRNFFVSIS